MISAVGASLQTGPMLDPVDPVLSVSDVVTYAKPIVTGSGGFKIIEQAAGRIAFDLNDGYSMWVDESQSAVDVRNAANKEAVRVWGAAQLALDGTALGSIAGTTSLVLANGTKITLQTMPETWATDIFHLDRLTVTQGDLAMVVSGVSQERGGDLTVAQSQKGDSIDDQTRDGLVFEQVAPNPEPPAPAPPTAAPLPPPDTNTLSGWADEYGVAVTPEMLAATLPGGDFGPGSELLSRGEFYSLIMRFLSWGTVSSLMSLASNSINSDMRRQDPADVARSADIRRSWARHADEMAAASRESLRNSETRALELSG
jgi:Domain of Unknown Function (DUF1521)